MRYLICKLAYSSFFFLVSLSILLDQYEKGNTFTENLNFFVDKIKSLNCIKDVKFFNDPKNIVYLVAYSYVLFANLGLLVSNIFYYFLVWSYIIFSLLFDNYLKLFLSMKDVNIFHLKEQNLDNIRSICFFISIIGTGLLLSQRNK